MRRPRGHWMARSRGARAPDSWPRGSGCHGRRERGVRGTDGDGRSARVLATSSSSSSSCAAAPAVQRAGLGFVRPTRRGWQLEDAAVPGWHLRTWALKVPSLEGEGARARKSGRGARGRVDGKDTRDACVRPSVVSEGASPKPQRGSRWLGAVVERSTEWFGLSSCARGARRQKGTGTRKPARRQFVLLLVLLMVRRSIRATLSHTLPTSTTSRASTIHTPTHAHTHTHKPKLSRQSFSRHKPENVPSLHHRAAPEMLASSRASAAVRPAAAARPAPLGESPRPSTVRMRTRRGPRSSLPRPPAQTHTTH